jgi:hypothetical protein
MEVSRRDRSDRPRSALMRIIGNGLLSTRSPKIKVALSTIAVLGLAIAVLLVPKIRAARAEARSRPFVSLFGHGSSNHMTYHLTIGGTPTPALEQEIVSILLALEDSLRRVAETGNEAGVRIHTCLYIHAPSSLRDRLASSAETIHGLDTVVRD